MVRRQRNARSDKFMVGDRFKNDSLKLDSLGYAPKCASPDSDKKRVLPHHATRHSLDTSPP